MEYKKLKDLVDEHLSIREISDRLSTSFSNTRYWLRKYSLTTNHRANRIGRSPEYRLCKCGEKDPSNFYGSKKSQCKRCDLKYTIDRGRNNRDRIIKELGGRCQNCGYSEAKAALCAHHLRPGQKDPSFGSSRGWSWRRIQQEMSKCILLCANCHAGAHSGEIKLKQLECDR